HEITTLAERGEPKTFHVIQVREANRKYILENRRLRAQLAARNEYTLLDKLRRARAMPPQVFLFKAVRWGLRKAPGGKAVLDALGKLRATLRSRAIEPQAEETSIDRWSLPLRPIDRRRAMLRHVETAL